MINERDAIDANRKLPLTCPEDALSINTSRLSLDEVVSIILKEIAKRDESSELLKTIPDPYEIVRRSLNAYFTTFHDHTASGVNNIPKQALSYLLQPL